MTDDPLRDWEQKCNQEEMYLSNLPKCDNCGEPIEEVYWSLFGYTLCEKCVDDAKVYID
jgi:formylmethanofuran dehydrogenase subunit E